MNKLLLSLTILAFVRAAPAMAQHDHGSMPMPMGGHEGHSDHGEDDKKSLQRKLTKLQDKIDAIEKKLEATDLAPKKRAKLEKKLKKIYAKKDELLGKNKPADHAGH